MVAFVPHNVGHSLTLYPSDPANALPFDDSVVVLVGNDPGSCQPMVLPNTAFSRLANLRTKHHEDYIVGVDQLTHAPAILRAGPWANTKADTDVLSIRPAMLLPAGEVGNALTTVPDGTYSYIGFYDAFLHPVINAGVTADINVYTPLIEWWRCVCTETSQRLSQIARILRLACLSIPSPKSVIVPWAGEAGLLPA